MLQPSVNSNSNYSPEMLNSVKNWQLFVPCDFEIWRMALKNIKVLFLCYFNLCTSFRGYRSMQIRVTVQKHSIRMIIFFFLSHVTLKFDGWPWKTTGHLFCATSSFVYNFTTIGEFILELQSGNIQIRVKIADRGPVRHWNLIDWKTKEYFLLLRALWVMSQPSVNSNSSYSPENFLRYFKLCASFRSHLSI